MEMSEPQVLTSEAVQLAEKYSTARRKKQELEADLTDLKAELDIVGAELTKKMEDLGLQKFALVNHGTFYLQTSFYPKILNEQEVIRWLDEHEAGAIAQRAVNKPAFKEAYKEWLNNDQPLPPSDLVDAHSETSVRLRASKKGAE